MKKINLLAILMMFTMMVPLMSALRNEDSLIKYEDLTRKEKTYNIKVVPYEYKYGKKVINGYIYIDLATNKEAKIVANKGEKLTINVKNETNVNVTNVHWHGLKVPNKEDGPMVVIKKGETYTYNFVVPDTGTYWYHSHARPVRDQVDEGMFSTFVILDEKEKAYNQDLLFVLDDVGGKELLMENSNLHMMEIVGDIKTINGIETKEFPQVEVIKGERIKLRFLNASTAETQNLRLSKHEFIVTHLDGVALNKSYKTKKIQMYPGQRVDAELVLDQSDEEIKNSTGSSIKLHYLSGEVKTPKSPFVGGQSKKLVDSKNFKPNRTIVLNSKMDHSKANMTIWTIDNKEFPEVEPVKIKKGETYYLRIQNNDTKNMHPMHHPIHLHGAHFQVVSVNGKEPEVLEFRDTVNVPAGGYVDIAFKIEEKGNWMLHCHILDHEDGGMMMHVEVI